jgi:hypothetical protein
MSIARSAFLILLLACSRPVFAEGRCPPGYFPTNNPDFVGCAPNNAPTLGGSNSASSLPPDPGPQWDGRWGAIAIDEAEGVFGAVDGQADMRKAKKAAIKQCRKNGGSKCKIKLEYHNQCGTLAWGADKYVTYGGPLPDEIVKRGIELCNGITSNCHISYLGCSYPELR